jgi:hypothetical protein
MRQAPEIERMLVRSGILLFKYWFSVTQGEQLAALPAREGSAQAVEAVAHRQGVLDKWDDYTEAKEAMFFYTDTADAPWTIVKSDDKKRARLNCMKHFLSSLPYPNKAGFGRPHRRRRRLPTVRLHLGPRCLRHGAAVAAVDRGHTHLHDFRPG